MISRKPLRNPSASSSSKFWRASSPKSRRPQCGGSVAGTAPVSSADGEVEIAPRRLAAAGVPQSKRPIRQAHQGLTGGEVRFPIVLRLRAKDGIVEMLRPVVTVTARREAESCVLVIRPVAAVKHEVE